ncbi:MAG: hypothetical protein IPP49_02545 [Saprospiraceae bacterium]|nr:hypothetical protein [Saprospiraceae bacterium]
MQSVSKWVLGIVIVGLIACKGDSKKEASPTASKPNATVTAPETTGPEIPGVPEQVMVKLLNECTYVDYIFHKLPLVLVGQKITQSTRISVLLISRGLS